MMKVFISELLHGINHETYDKSNESIEPPCTIIKG
jgi:hypothetical protein